MRDHGGSPSRCSLVRRGRPPGSRAASCHRWFRRRRASRHVTLFAGSIELTMVAIFEWHTQRPNRGEGGDASADLDAALAEREFMKAMVLDRPGERLRLAELPVPEPGAGQILVRVKACAVCRTDLHVVDGELPEPKLPLVPGHEIVGEVAARRAGRRSLPPGRARRHPVARLHLRQVPVLPGRPGEPVRCGALHRLSDRRRLRRVHGRGRPLLFSDPGAVRRPRGGAAAVRRADRLSLAAHGRAPASGWASTASARRRTS